MACKDFADSSNSGLAFGKQLDCGTPQSQLEKLRITSSDLQFSAESTQSEEIRSDGNVSDLIRTATSVGGSFGFELSYETFDSLIQGALMNGTALDGVGTPIIGRNETNFEKSYFTFEDVTKGDMDYFRVFTDCEINTLSLSIEQGSPLTGTFDVLGRASTTGTTSVDPDGYDDTNSNPVYNAVSMVSSIKLDGAEVGDVQSVTIDMTNNLREQRAIGSVEVAGVGAGQFVLTGTMSIYFSDNALYQKFLNDDTFSFELELDDGTGTTGNKINMTLPTVKFDNVNWTIPGNNQDILLEASYQAIYNSGIGGTVSISTTDAT